MKNELEIKFCDYDRRYAKAERDIPGCMAYNPIKCTKYNEMVSKSQLCLDELGGIKNDTR